MRWATLGLLVLVAAGAPRTALTQEEDPESLIRQGVELRRKGDDLRAEGYFKRAYRLARTPRSAAQLGLVELALKKDVEANQYLTEALSDTDDGWVKKQRAPLEASRRDCRSRLLEVDVSGAPEGARVVVGSGTAVPLAKDGKLWIAPGSVSLVVERNAGVLLTKTVAGGAGDLVQVSMPPQPAPAGPPAEAPRPQVATPASPEAPASTVAEASPEAPAVTVAPPMPEPRADVKSNPAKVAGLAIGITGAAALVTGVVLYQVATNKYDALAAGLKGQPYDNSDYDWKAYDRLGLSLMIGGGVALAAGATLFVLGHRDTSADAHPVALLVVPARAGVGLLGAF